MHRELHSLPPSSQPNSTLNTATLVVQTAQGAQATVDLTLTVSPATGTRAAGNGNTPSTPLAVPYDCDPPTVSLSRSGTAPVNGPVTVTITFSEPVAGLTVGDISVIEGGAAAGLTGSGDAYTVEITPPATGTGQIQVSSTLAIPYNHNRPEADFTAVQPLYTAQPDTVSFRISSNDSSDTLYQSHLPAHR